MSERPDSAYQLIDADLTAIAALSTTSFGRGFLPLADAAAARTYIGAGTGSGTVTSVSGTAPIASSGGDTPAISLNDGGVTYAKMQDVSATDKVLGRSTAGAGDVEEIACTAAGRALIDDADAAAQRTTLGLGTLATQSGTFSGTSSGTNTGDQSSIVGITGSLAEFNTALTGADFATGGGTVTGASSGTNTGDQTSIVGITGTIAQFNTALSDGDFATGGGTATGTNTGDQTLYNQTVENAGTPVTQRGTVNFTGAGVSVADAGGKTVVTVSAGGGASATTVEQNLSATPAWQGKFTITDAAIASTSKVLCWQAPGSYTGKGTLADEAQMQPVNVVAVAPATGSAVVYWETPAMVAVNLLTNRGKFTPVGATFDRAGNQRYPPEFLSQRIGKVRGNVKFSYMVLA